MTKSDLAEMMERFIGDKPNCGDREWDVFTSVRAEPELEPFRQRLLEQGDGLFDITTIRTIISELRN